MHLSLPFTAQPGTLPWDSAAAKPAPSPLPKSPAHGQPWSTFGQPSLASPVTMGYPLPLSPSRGRQPGYSPGPRRIVVPHCFRGSCPVPAPGPRGMAPITHPRSQTHSGSPKLLTSFRSMYIVAHGSLPPAPTPSLGNLSCALSPPSKRVLRLQLSPAAVQSLDPTSDPPPRFLPA